jgi:hypothetical protein
LSGSGALEKFAEVAQNASDAPPPDRRLLAV